MAITETLVENGTLVERTLTDDVTGRVLVQSFSPAPGTPEHDEPINQEALADKLHTTLSRISVRDDIDPDVRDAFLLIHRFLHADYSDAEV